ncbi:hypothetical protein OS493_034791 [Desmophyllum pertusum]|uniref:Uncharacterized protein n=1 Tax=Desmophyllum pertusum TaxID=174260 RepID=A0A9W9YLN9_9CNID|nr:hypothetical protein OS493_034791 [Desmophyllum pertusum]
MASSSECKPHKEDGTPFKDVSPDGSHKTVTSAASKKPTVLRRTTAVFAVILLVSGVVLTATFLTRKQQTSGSLVEVNLEQGETLTYQVEQNLEVQSGELQKGTIYLIDIKSQPVTTLRA